MTVYNSTSNRKTNEQQKTGEYTKYQVLKSKQLESKREKRVEKTGIRQYA